MRPKILLVDNDKGYQEALKAFLEQTTKYKILTANTAKEALADVAKEKPDVAVVDLRLEEEGNVLDYSGLHLIRDLPRNMPAIILSANDDKDAFQAIINAYGGRVKYLLKGKERVALVPLIEAALATRRSPLSWIAWILVVLLAFAFGWSLKPFNRTFVQSLTGDHIVDRGFVQGVLSSLVATAVWLAGVWLVGRIFKKTVRL